MPTTSNFGWTTPADTDLVKDGAAAIRTLGNGIDTSLVDLKGGTTGQILSKATNTDLDYTWVTPNVGDITEVQAGTGISVASGTGPIPVVTNTVATTFDAKGDLVVGTGADTFSKLTVGTNGHTLVADSSTSTGLAWAAPAGGGKVLQVVSASSTTDTTVASTTFTDTTLSASITPSSTNSKVLILVTQVTQYNRGNYDAGGGLRIVRGSTAIYTLDTLHAGLFYSNVTTSAQLNVTLSMSYLDSPSTTSSTTYKTQGRALTTSNSGQAQYQPLSTPSQIILLEIGA